MNKPLCECGCGEPVSIAPCNYPSRGWIKGKPLRFIHGHNPVARTHGMTGTPTYRSWQHMRERCSNPKCKDFPAYGARGITVCPRWQVFENFLTDMGKKPERMSLDRIDNNLNYEPDNCRWASARTQANNTRKVVAVTFNGETHSISEWSRRMNIGRPTISYRYSKGYRPPELFRPLRGSH